MSIILVIAPLLSVFGGLCAISKSGSFRSSSPNLEMQIWNDERTNIRKVPPKLAEFLLVLHVGEQTSHYQPITHGFNQVSKSVALAVAQRALSRK
jgi:hypothetical protein